MAYPYGAQETIISATPYGGVQETVVSATPYGGVQELFKTSSNLKASDVIVGKSE
jgi:hypothetical protein